MDKIKNRIDYTFLMEVLAVQSSGIDDTQMSAYIKNKLTELDVKVEEDNYGNIYVTKGISTIYPCLIAHTDTVHPVINKFNLFRSEDMLFAYNPDLKKLTGIGGDDKVGVFILLQALIDLPTLKTVFYRHEESGCHGSRYSIKNHKDWYKDCGYVIEPDRRGNNDAVTNSGSINITSREFVDDFMPFMQKYGYHEAVGTFTDVDTIVVHKIGISAINVSCGYHNSHTSIESVSISEVNIAYNLIFDMVSAYSNKQYLHIPIIKPYISTYKGKNNKWSETIERAAPTVGLNSSINARQTKIFPPLVYEKYGRKTFFDDFIEYDVLKNNKKVYRYTGVNALSLIGDLHCPHCKSDVLATVFYLPYEGRMYCSKCMNYVIDTQVQSLLKALEVEDNNITFVYSVYSNGWLDKDSAVWSDKVQSWVPDDLPF